MKKTFYEKVRARILAFGRKNRIFHFLALVALVVASALHLIGVGIGSNGKRIAMLMVTFVYLVVFSSFSFPAFIGTVTIIGSIDFEEKDESVELVSDDGEAEILFEETDEIDTENSMLNEELEVQTEEALILDTNAILSVSNLSQITDLPDVENGVESELSFSRDDWKLMLVNKQNFIPEDYEVPLATIINDKKCDERVLPYFLAMLKGAADDGVTLMLCSPYRAADLQVSLFERKITRYLAGGLSYIESYKKAAEAVTIPGSSEHELGMSFDIVSPTHTVLNAAFGETVAGKWLKNHCAEYGFILRYPKDKEYITTIEYEPWHFRYVGVEAASIIMEENLCLEEFWEEYVQ